MTQEFYKKAEHDILTLLTLAFFIMGAKKPTRESSSDNAIIDELKASPVIRMKSIEGQIMAP